MNGSLVMGKVKHECIMSQKRKFTISGDDETENLTGCICCSSCSHGMGCKGRLVVRSHQGNAILRQTSRSCRFHCKGKKLKFKTQRSCVSLLIHFSARRIFLYGSVFTSIVLEMARISFFISFIFSIFQLKNEIN